jgi:hypothetical protein
MKVTENIINDLIPLYVANECSPDTRVLVEEYLKQNPLRAAEVQQIINSPLPGVIPTGKALEEVRAFQEARRRLRQRSWLMGFAIFFTLAPLSFVYSEGRTWWLLRDAPGAALIFFMVGVSLWLFYAVKGAQSRNP